MFCDGGITNLQRWMQIYAKSKSKLMIMTCWLQRKLWRLQLKSCWLNYQLWHSRESTRVIQRVGRINRMSAKVFDELFIYNFFLLTRCWHCKKRLHSKMFLIHSALGEDSRFLMLMKNQHQVAYSVK